MSVSSFAIVLTALMINSAAVIFFKKIALKNKILLSNSVPLIGGIAMGATFFLISSFIIIFSGCPSRELLGVLLASALMLLFGILDDLKEQSVLLKLVFQIIAVTILVLFGSRTKIMNMSLGLNLLFTFLWVIAITNAFNHLDVMDGLAGLTAIVIGSSLFIVSFLKGDNGSAYICFAIAACTFSFLFFNLPPAKIYMGNSGSHFLGFLLSAMALVTRYAPEDNRIALLCPVFIFCLPILDTSYVIVKRLAKGRMPFNKSNDHLATRFLALGYSKQRILFFFSVFTLFSSFSGVSLTRYGWVQAAAFFIAATILAIFLISKANEAQVDG